jgi:hypothetical protein
VAEWFKAHAWKVCVLSKVPWVRIPFSPPLNCYKSSYMKKNKIKFKDCFFYHVQDLPNHSKPTKGIYDLRGNVNKYLGNVNLKIKKYWS